jgi:glucosamine--fructose-6-phosphate aminotransferase (isomerizing)
LPDHVSAVLGDPGPAQGLAQEWMNAERLFVVARGLMFAAALECALKIKETSGVLAEGISSADLRHGPIAAVDQAVPVLLLNGGGAVKDDLGELAGLLAARGAPVAELPLPAAVPEALTVIPAVVRAQQLALALARAHGLDPDAPEGLAKVTKTH